MKFKKLEGLGSYSAAYGRRMMSFTLRIDTMNFRKSTSALALIATLGLAAPAFAGPQGKDTTYGALAGAAAGGLVTHSVTGAVVGGVGGALIGNAIGRHSADHYRRNDYYRHHHYERHHYDYRGHR